MDKEKSKNIIIKRKKLANKLINNEMDLDTFNVLGRGIK